MPTEIHKHAARMIWQGYSTLDIVSELQNKFDIGDSAERELYIKAGQLRAQIKEARELAPAAAEKLLRDGYTPKEVAEILSRPYLLSNFEIDGIVSKAQNAVKAEQA